MIDAEESAGLPKPGEFDAGDWVWIDEPDHRHVQSLFWRGVRLGLAVSAIGWALLIAAALPLWG